MNCKTRRHTKAAARAVGKALRYRVISGQIAADLDAGLLVRTGDVLDRLGAGNLKDGHKSGDGRHVKKAHVAANGRDPIRVWVQHRTTGKWIHVHVYAPVDPSLYEALHTYNATRPLLQAQFTEVA